MIQVLKDSNPPIKLTREQLDCLSEALGKEKSRRISLWENANAQTNKFIPSKDFSIETIDSLIKIFFL